MTGTIRISRSESSPSTSFYLSANELAVTEADIAANSTRVRCYIRAVNGGNSSSQYNGAGSQSGSIDGVGTFRTHSGDPFLPSGYAGGQERWEDGPYDVTVPHNSDGTKTAVLRMVLNYGSISRNLTANLTLTPLKAAPETPTDVVAARVSDTEVSVSWAQSSPSNSQPTSNTIRRRINAGGWTDVVTVSPTTSAAIGASANQKLVYGVKGTNSAGVSAWSADSAPIFTTPGAPTGVTATKDASLNIVVSFTPHVAFTEHEHLVVHGTVTGGVTTWDGSPSASLPAGTATFTDVSPNPSDVHVYKVFAQNTDVGALTSAEVASNSVQLLAPPNKPTLPALGPNVDKGKAFVVNWAHNPVDTTPQKFYEVGYSTNGGTTWSTTGKVTSAVSSYSIPASTYAANDELTVRVRTWGEAATGGADGAGASAWSDQGTVTFKTRPVVTITAPVNGGTYTQAKLFVELGFSQAEAATFVSATIALYEGATLLESKLSTTRASTIMGTRLADGGSYEVRVTVLDSNGLRSDLTVSAFTVAYTLPVTAGVTVTYLPDSGIAQLDLTIASPGVGEVAAVAVTITRTIDGVSETIVEDYPAAPTLTVLDMTPTVHGTNGYTVTTSSVDGATAEATTELVTDDIEGWAFLSSGDGFAAIIRFRSNLRVAATPTRASALVQAAGRTSPLALFGVGVSLTVSGSASIFIGPESSPQEIEAFIRTAGIVCYRDPTGRRVFGRLQGALSTPSMLVSEFQFTVSEAT